MKKIYFVRHGLSEANKSDVVQDGSDPLSEEGHAQAESVAKRLKNVTFDILYSSPYERTQKTAQAIAAVSGHTIVIDDNLHELVHLQEYTGMSRKDPRFLARPQLSMTPSLEEYNACNGESFEVTFARAESFLNRIRDGKEDIVCAVTHASFLQFILLYVLMNGKPTVEQWGTFWGGAKMSNAGITVLEYRKPRRPWPMPERWVVLQWNDDAHLG